MADIIFPDGTLLKDLVGNQNVFSSDPSTSVGAGEIIYQSTAATLKVNTQTVNPTTNPIWTSVGGGGVTDHGALTGLTDDDHTHYYNSVRHTKAIHDSLALDHGSLSGLSDDDHTQYMPVNASRNFTGDVSIDTATPSLDFAEGGSFRGGVYVNATDDFVMECELGKIILGTDPTNGDVIEINPKAGGVVATFDSDAIDFAQSVSATKVVTGDHGTAATDEVVNVCYGTSATPPTASTTTEGALYIQYTA
jgi:hypothetical protein